MAYQEFHHLGVVCRDPVASEAFYTRYFGFRRARVVPLGGDDQIVFLKSGPLYLELFKATQANPAPEPADRAPSTRAGATSRSRSTTSTRSSRSWAATPASPPAR